MVHMFPGRCFLAWAAIVAVSEPEAVHPNPKTLGLGFRAALGEGLGFRVEDFGFRA